MATTWTDEFESLFMEEISNMTSLDQYEASPDNSSIPSNNVVQGHFPKWHPPYSVLLGIALYLSIVGKLRPFHALQSLHNLPYALWL